MHNPILRSPQTVRWLLVGALFVIVLGGAASSPAAALQSATQAPPATNTPRGTTEPATATSSRTPSPTKTPTNTRTPTKTPTVPPTMVIMGTYETPVQTPVAPIPPPLPTPKPSGDDVVTILLLGSDTITHTSASRTDVIILLAVDRTAGTATLMHIPRDLFVYVPNYTMTKINTVVNYGNTKNGDGTGAKLMADTLLYNLGIKVDFYARVDFVQFEHLIAKLGGLDISVDCAIQDYRLKSPELDYTKPESYELYTMPIGRRKLDPYMALWYVRSRATSSDFDRGRRQMDVLRAMWRQARDAGLLTQVTSLWPEVQNIVETNMTLQDILGFVPTALSLNPDQIQRIDLALNVHFKVGQNLGSYGLIPDPTAMQTAIQNFMLPPSPNRLNGENPTIEIGAALPLKGYDQVAADRLSWEGFSAKVIGTEGVVNREATVIYDYTGGSRPSSLQTLIKLLRVGKSQVIAKPDPNRTVDFRVEMGKDYASCLYAIPKDAGVTPEPK